jgi:uncharacterized tellurite resistance protein B-like protein
VSLRRWLGLQGADVHATDVDSLAEIERALEGLEPGRARYIACFAYILGRVARADHQISDGESREMERMVAGLGGLPASQAALVVQIARAQGLRFGGTEDFIVTREFARLASRDEKLALLECLFAVSAADESIRTTEDNEIRRIVSELKLEHTDFIAARSAFLMHFEVLRRPNDS